MLVGEVRWLQERTIYTRLGDVVAYLAVATTLALLLVVHRH